MQERLHKILAHAGFGSRRACEGLIEAGRVTVNGRAVTVGHKADLGEDDVRVDGRRVKPERTVYYLLNKPPGVLCTNADPGGRRRAIDLLAGVTERVYPVGRLDADSRGLLILTNDGDLAALLTHPRYEVPKTYEAEVSGRVSPEDVETLRAGLWLSDGRTSGATVRVAHRGNARSQIRITLREGRNRQVRRVMARLGHRVRRLTRIQIGPLTLRGLGPGKFRRLTPAEVRALYKTARSRASAKAEGQRRGPQVGTGKTAATRMAGAGQKRGGGRGQSRRKRSPATKGARRNIRDFTA